MERIGLGVKRNDLVFRSELGGMHSAIVGQDQVSS